MGRVHGGGSVPAAPRAELQPLVVLHGGRVWDADRAARAFGVRPGQSQAQARAASAGACVELAWRTFDRAADDPVLVRAWDLIAEASSTVEPDSEGRPQAFAAWSGASPPLPQLRALSEGLRRRFPGVNPAIGIAGTRLVARLCCPGAAAAGAGVGFAAVLPGDEARFLAARPLTAIEEDGLILPALRTRLEHLALRTCGDVAALGEGLLQARFGREGRRLHALCAGRDERPVHALHPPRVLVARRSFPDGLPPEAWPQAAGALARRAAAGLGPTEGACRLVLTLRGDGVAGRGWIGPGGAGGTPPHGAGSGAAASGGTEPAAAASNATTSARASSDSAPAVRAWKAPRRSASLIARAAAALATRTAAGSTPAVQVRRIQGDGGGAAAAGPVGLVGPAMASAIEVRLEALASLPARAASLLPPVVGERAEQERPALDDLLERLPERVLRRGYGAISPYEAWLCLLDPWRRSGGDAGEGAARPSPDGEGEGGDRAGGETATAEIRRPRPAAVAARRPARGRPSVRRRGT